MLNEMNAKFDHNYVDPHAHHDEHHDHLAPPGSSSIAKSSQKKKRVYGRKFNISKDAGRR
ncbi:hypothetical protein GCM10020331_089030 [Ectobacillus funiculus]